MWTDNGDRFLVKGTRQQVTQNQVVGSSNGTLVLASREGGWMTIECIGDPERIRSYRVPDGALVGRDELATASARS